VEQMESGLYQNHLRKHAVEWVVMVDQPLWEAMVIWEVMAEKQQSLQVTMGVWEVMVKPPRKVEWDTMVQIQQNLQQALNVLPRKF